MELLPTKRTVVRVAGSSGGNSGLAKGMDLVFGLLFFFGIGWALDRVLGTGRWLSIIFLAVAAVGQFARMWYAYDADMRLHEDELLKGRGR